MTRIPIRTFAATTIALVCAAVALVFADGSNGAGAVSLSGAGFTETFNGLTNSGAAPSAILPAGWYLSETGTAVADGSYIVGTGSSNAGNSYSFGATGSTDRALGSVGSGSLTKSQYGAQILNNTGGVITSVTVTYVGEIWRRGPAAADGLVFEYSTNATSLTAGTFTPVPALDFVSPTATCLPIPPATTAGAANGNDANCRRSITATITGLSIHNGVPFWIRWTDVDNAGSDDGVAIDDVSVSATFITSYPTALGSPSPNPGAPGGIVTFTGPITPAQNPTSLSYSVTCDLSSIGLSPSQPLATIGAAINDSIALPANTQPGAYSFPCTVADDQARSSNFSIGLGVAIPLNPACSAPATPIHAIQGTGATSPLLAQVVDVEGIVVGDFQAPGQLNGYYVQEPAETDDGNPLTSEGIFVFNSSLAVAPGDRVRVRGTVSEFVSNGPPASNLTELFASPSNNSLCGSGPLPAPVTISLPVASVSDFERYEGMLVQFTQQLVVTGNFSLGTFGQIDLAPAVLFQPTHTAANVATWTAIASLNSRSRVALDDASTLINAAVNGGGVAPYPSPGLSAANTLRVGALVNPSAGGPTPLVGILDDRFGAYRIQPTDPVTFSNSPNPRPDTAAIVNALGGRFRVSSANVLNFFTTLGSRGAATPTEFTNQRAKLIAKLVALNSDIYGLSEIQNFANGGTSGGTYTNSAIGDLTAALATATGRNYQFLDTINAANVVGGNITQNGTDAIRNAIIYDANRVTLVGLAALYYQNDTNRPSLAQTFKPASGLKAAQQTFTVVVNHFRSKGSTCGGASDDPLQGNCNGLRLLMANNVQTWLAGNPTADPAGANRKYLLIGDFNAYLGEDPIQAFVSGGAFTNLIDKLIGPGAYSYNFGSQNGYLDHALVNPALLPLTKSVAELHVNADEPASLQALDSGLKSPTAQAAYFAPNEFAASDHDPIVIALNPLPGDLTDDGVVDLADRNVLVAAYGKPASQVDRRLDYDGDGIISPNDYRIWFTYYRAFIL